MKVRQLKFLIGIAIIIGAIIYLVYSNFQASFLYYLTVRETAQKAQELVGKRIRMAGTVQEGSLLKSPEANTYKFALKDGPYTISVTYKGALPDTFREQGEAVVEGALTSPNEFKADLVFAKCPSKYESKTQTEKEGQSEK